MKFIESKQLQEAKGRKRGKYLLTLEVTDYDIEMFEDLAWADCSQDNLKGTLKIQYSKWLQKCFRVFHKLWRKYDTFISESNENKNKEVKG